MGHIRSLVRSPQVLRDILVHDKMRFFSLSATHSTEKYLGMNYTTLIFHEKKPARYGILFKSINAVDYAFTFTTCVYANKPEITDNAPYYHPTVLELTKSLVANLERHVDLQGRNLSSDRYYTSIDLAEFLLSRNMTIIGTIQINRRGIPPAIKSIHNRKVFSYEVYFCKEIRDLAIHSYVVKPKSSGTRNVLLLTTHPVLLGTTKDEKQKPAAYKQYDMSKGGVDIQGRPYVGV